MGFKSFISIVIPVFNEEENLETLYFRLKDFLEKKSIENYEIIFVDDGSKDSSWEIIKKLKLKDSKVKGIRFARNFGQTLALYAGFEEATGDIVITLDADLQNDPEDIEVLLKELEKGYDVVSGLRKKRKDPFLTKVLPSRIANFLISFITGIKLKDYGCTLRAYKSEVIKSLRLYGEMHRFLPALCVYQGAKLKEVEVKHNKRFKGKSKYGLKRTFKVLLDLLTVKFMGDYFLKPMHFFGIFGLIFIFLGIIFLFWAFYDFFFLKLEIFKNFKTIIAIIFLIPSIQLILTGLLMEILIRNYFESQNRKPFIVKEKI
ncbi:MAG: glycosyltransferase family 2 protein [Candidatus Hydrothermales bacterium]